MKQLFFLLLFLPLFHSSKSAGESFTTVVYSGCSDDKVSPATAYQINLNSLLTSLANAAGFSTYSNFTSSLSSASYPIYGLYQCRSDTSISDCEKCVQMAISMLSSTCSNSADATIQLRGCLVRYGKESFLGKPDKNLQFKRCGPGVGSGSYDPNSMGMRDQVLNALMAGQGSYRVSQAGVVIGSAQCVGDQDSKHCKDCLSDAVSDLKNLCGMTVSAEVYLGKCYAEYSIRGANGVYSTQQSKNDRANEAGKDLAIIIGVVAAVLLLVLFINYLQRSQDKGKY